MIMERVKTDDAIPYWDYDAPVTDETPRDASAASVTASALIELSTLVEDGQNIWIMQNCSKTFHRRLIWQRSVRTKDLS